MTQVDAALALTSNKSYVDTQLALKSFQSTTFTKTAVDTKLNQKVNTAAIIGAVALQSDNKYVENQLALTANQLTTYTNNRGRYSLRAESASINHIHQDRSWWSSITKKQISPV